VVTVTRHDDRESARFSGIIVVLAAWLALAPLLQALSLAGLCVANFAPDRPWNYLAYGLVAPYVAWLVWRRHPRARFATYVFLTHEVLRGVHLHRRDAVAIAALWVLLLQLPAARRWMPSLRPAEIRARWRRQLTRDRRGRAGAARSAPTAPDARPGDSPPP
jgi:hypothetical protein